MTIFRSFSTPSISLVALVLFAVASACGGGGNGSPTGMSSSTVVSGSTGAAGPSGATITITANGVSPSQVSISIGQSVTFVNDDNRSHEFASNPHPTHGSCPSIEAGLGTLAAGQTKLTQGFAGAGTCGFHDHMNPSSSSLQGQIVIR
jgi:plastocyanin